MDEQLALDGLHKPILDQLSEEELEALLECWRWVRRCDGVPAEQMKHPKLEQLGLVRRGGMGGWFDVTPAGKAVLRLAIQQQGGAAEHYAAWCL